MRRNKSAVDQIQKGKILLKTYTSSKNQLRFKSGTGTSIRFLFKVLAITSKLELLKSLTFLKSINLIKTMLVLSDLLLSRWQLQIENQGEVFPMVMMAYTLKWKYWTIHLLKEFSKVEVAKSCMWPQKHSQMGWAPIKWNKERHYFKEVMEICLMWGIIKQSHKKSLDRVMALLTMMRSRKLKRLFQWALVRILDKG
jgi:hypothetical protein